MEKFYKANVVVESECKLAEMVLETRVEISRQEHWTLELTPDYCIFILKQLFL